MEYPSDIDTEIIPLCDALNSFDGVQTLFSCCGHNELNAGESPFYVAFSCSSCVSLSKIAACAWDFNYEYTKHGWFLELVIEGGMNNVLREKEADSKAVIIRLSPRKCHKPVSLEDLDELTKLVLKYKKDD